MVYLIQWLIGVGDLIVLNLLFMPFSSAWPEIHGSDIL